MGPISRQRISEKWLGSTCVYAETPTVKTEAAMRNARLGLFIFLLEGLSRTTYRDLGGGSDADNDELAA
jgi:hypothetical protein